MMQAKTSVTALAEIMGIFWVNTPNNNHNKVPNANSEYIPNDIPDVSFVCIVFIACGRKEIVVHAAANRPIMFM